MFEFSHSMFGPPEAALEGLGARDTVMKETAPPSQRSSFSGVTDVQTTGGARTGATRTQRRAPTQC